MITEHMCGWVISNIPRVFHRYFWKVFNPDRARYLADHEDELGYYPTRKGLTADELYDELIDAMGKGQEANLAHAKKTDSFSSSSCELDFQAKDNGSSSIRPDTARHFKMFDKYLRVIKDEPDYLEQQSSVEIIKDTITSSIGTDKPQKVSVTTICQYIVPRVLTICVSQLVLVPHYNRNGDPIDRIDFMTNCAPRNSVAAAVIDIYSIRTTLASASGGGATTAPKRKGAGKPAGKGAGKSTTKGAFMHVTLPITLVGVHHLIAGEPYSKEVVPVKYVHRFFYCVSSVSAC
jgi:hypothetical protein